MTCIKGNVRIMYLLDSWVNYYSNFSLFPSSQISYDKGEKYAAQINALFCETRSLNVTNVEELFIQISKCFMCVLYVLGVPLSISFVQTLDMDTVNTKFLGGGIGGGGSSGLFWLFLYP